MMKNADWVGWLAGVILLATVGTQVFTQWKAGTIQGLSRWLFIGQIAASIGFVIYSWAVENWVFVVTNFFMLITACLGQIIFLRNRDKVDLTKDTKAGVNVKANTNAKTNLAAASNVALKARKVHKKS
jgi:hypothetical protein